MEKVFSFTLLQLLHEVDPNHIHHEEHTEELAEPFLIKAYGSSLLLGVYSSHYRRNHRIYQVKVIFKDFFVIARDKEIPIGDAVKYAIENLDIHITCTCPAHLYFGYKYMATQLGYAYGLDKENRFPKRNNPALRGSVCKHGDKVLRWIVAHEQDIVHMFEQVYRNIDFSKELSKYEAEHPDRSRQEAEAKRKADEESQASAQERAQREAQQREEESLPPREEIDVLTKNPQEREETPEEIARREQEEWEVQRGGKPRRKGFMGQSHIEEANDPELDKLQSILSAGETPLPLAQWNAIQKQYWMKLASEGIVQKDDYVSFYQFGKYFRNYYDRTGQILPYSRLVAYIGGYLSESVTSAQSQGSLDFNAGSVILYTGQDGAIEYGGKKYLFGYAKRSTASSYFNGYIIPVRVEIHNPLVISTYEYYRITDRAGNTDRTEYLLYVIESDDKFQGYDSVKVISSDQSDKPILYLLLTPNLDWESMIIPEAELEQLTEASSQGEMKYEFKHEYEVLYGCPEQLIPGSFGNFRMWASSYAQVLSAYSWFDLSLTVKKYRVWMKDITIISKKDFTYLFLVRRPDTGSVEWSDTVVAMADSFMSPKALKHPDGIGVTGLYDNYFDLVLSTGDVKYEEIDSKVLDPQEKMDMMYDSRDVALTALGAEPVGQARSSQEEMEFSPPSRIMYKNQAVTAEVDGVRYSVYFADRGSAAYHGGGWDRPYPVHIALPHVDIIGGDEFRAIAGDGNFSSRCSQAVRALLADPRYKDSPGVEVVGLDPDMSNDDFLIVLDNEYFFGSKISQASSQGELGLGDIHRFYYDGRCYIVKDNMVYPILFTNEQGAETRGYHDSREVSISIDRVKVISPSEFQRAVDHQMDVEEYINRRPPFLPQCGLFLRNLYRSTLWNMYDAFRIHYSDDPMDDFMVMTQPLSKFQVNQSIVTSREEDDYSWTEKTDEQIEEDWNYWRENSPEYLERKGWNTFDKFKQAIKDDEKKVRDYEGKAQSIKKGESLEPEDLAARGFNEDDYVKFHKTGHIGSDAYRDTSTEEWWDSKGCWFSDKSKYPVLVGTLLIGDGIEIEARSSGEKLKYTYWDDDTYTHRSDENGQLLYRSDEELKEQGLPLTDTTLYLFDGNKAVGWVSDEFGTDGVWIRPSYQGQGIGTQALRMFRKQFPRPRGKTGQATAAGTNLLRAYYRKYAKSSLEHTVKFSPFLVISETQSNPIWKLKSVEVLKDKMKGPQPGKNVLGMLRGAGVAQEELQEMGLSKLLDTDQKFSLDDILKHINETMFEVEEVNKNGSFTYNRDSQFATPKVVRLLHNIFDRLTPDDYEDATLMIENDSALYSAVSDLMKKFGFVDDEGYIPEDWSDIFMKSMQFKFSGMPKYKAYTVPGGKDYGELLLRYKRKEGTTHVNPHWDEEDVLAHTRFQTFNTVEGKKVFFIEEIQSDWWQESREKGVGIRIEWNAYNSAGTKLGTFSTEKEAQVAVDDSPEGTGRVYRADVTGVPEGPYKKSWPEFAFRRLLVEACRGEYSYIGWATGKMQSERYNLAHQVKEIAALSNGNGTYQVVIEKPDGQELEPYSRSGKEMKPNEISELVGKELADRLMTGADASKDKKTREGQKINPAFFTLQGEGLKVGGTGMIAFYDKILVNYANKIGRKYGSEVSEVPISTLGDIGRRNIPVHALPITPELKAAFQSAYMFQAEQLKGFEGIISGAQGDGLSRAIRKAGRSNQVMKALVDESEAQSGPFDGGCLIFAKALMMALGSGVLVRMESELNGGQTEHYGLAVGDTIYDASGGYHSPEEWISTFIEVEGIHDRTLRLADGYDPDSDIPDDPQASKKVATLLRPYLERVTSDHYLYESEVPILSEDFLGAPPLRYNDHGMWFDFLISTSKDEYTVRGGLQPLSMILPAMFTYMGVSTEEGTQDLLGKSGLRQQDLQSTLNFSFQLVDSSGHEYMGDSISGIVDDPEVRDKTREIFSTAVAWLATKASRVTSVMIMTFGKKTRTALYARLFAGAGMFGGHIEKQFDCQGVKCTLFGKTSVRQDEGLSAPSMSYGPSESPPPWLMPRKAKPRMVGLTMPGLKPMKTEKGQLKKKGKWAKSAKSIDIISVDFDKAPDHCEICGDKIEDVDDLRPYGPDGKWICFDCMMKDEGEAEDQFGKMLDGTHPEALVQAEDHLVTKLILIDSRDLEVVALQVYGETENPLEAGYIFPDGTMLDLSGKRQGGRAGVRALDHREVLGYLDDPEISKINTYSGDGSPTRAMWAFMKSTGAARVDFHSGRVQTIGIPTLSQQRVIGHALNGGHDYAILSIGTDNFEFTDYEINSPHYSDIIEFYSDPEGYGGNY